MRLTRIWILLSALALVAAACGGGTNTTGDDSALADDVAAVEDLADDVVAVEDDATHTDDEAAHEDEATHDDDEAAHEDEATHDDDEAAHEDEATHDDDEAGHEVEASGDPDRELEVVLSEFAFSPGTITVSMGETVRFVVRNEGVVEHEFRLTTEHAADEHIAAGHADHDDGAAAAASGDDHGEVMIMVAAGGTETVDVTFGETAEFDIVACLIPGHFEAGMHGDLVIEA